MAWTQLRDDEVFGKLLDIDMSQRMQQQVLLLLVLLDKNTDDYEPIVTVDLDNNRYLVLRSGDTPARVPPVDEIRADVVRAWKLSKGAEAAKKHADELAKKIEAAGSSLADHFAAEPAVKVIRTEPFSQLTMGDIPLSGGNFRFSEPEGLGPVGPAFLQTVFDLEPGGATSALNHDHSVAYLIRLAERVQPEEKLREMYLAEAETWPGVGIKRAQRRQVANQQFYESLRMISGVEEVRKLDVLETDE
jgi:hypothetical protein